MKIIKVTAILVGTFLGNAEVLAGTWTGRVSLHRVYVAASTVYAQTDPSSAHINPDGCKSSSNYAIDPLATLFKERYRLLLTGLASGKSVSLELAGCLGNYPKVTKVIIYR